MFTKRFCAEQLSLFGVLKVRWMMASVNKIKKVGGKLLHRINGKTPQGQTMKCRPLVVKL